MKFLCIKFGSTIYERMRHDENIKAAVIRIHFIEGFCKDPIMFRSPYYVDISYT